MLCPRPCPTGWSTLPPLDPATLVRASLAAPTGDAASRPSRHRRAARPAIPRPGGPARRRLRPEPDGRPARPHRAGRRGPTPAARGLVSDPAAAAARPTCRPPRQPHPPDASAPAWSAAHRCQPSELTGFLQATPPPESPQAGSVHRPHRPPHVPADRAQSRRRRCRRTPPTTRRNKGSAVWAVFAFLVVIAFASGLGQRIVEAISELFNR